MSVVNCYAYILNVIQTAFASLACLNNGVMTFPRKKEDMIQLTQEISFYSKMEEQGCMSQYYVI